MRGHIRRRGRKWALVIELCRDPQTGKRRQKWYPHKTRAEADAQLTQIRAAMQGGVWTPPAKISFGDFCQQWLQDYAAGAVGPLTLRNYRTIIEDHITPKLGHVPLDRLSTQAIQGFLSEMLQTGGKRKKGLHPNSVHKNYRVVKEILGHAVRWGLIARNPAELADPPKQRRREVQVWDEEQVRLFLAEAKRHSHYYALYLAAIMTGMRAGRAPGASLEGRGLHRRHGLGPPNVHSPGQATALQGTKDGRLEARDRTSAGRH